MNVLVYTGEGAARTSLDHAFFSLQQVLGHHYAIIPVTSQTLRHEPWEANAALLVMPGGRDLPYVRDLQGEANARIKRFVQRGGRYLGLCAGGYYGSARIEFEKGTPLSVCGPRDLGFFPGLCRGVAYPGFVYNSEQGARAIEVQPAWDEMPSHRLISPPDSNDSQQSISKGHDHLPPRFRVYYNGGGYFVDAHQYAATVDILASFTIDQHGAPWEHAAAIVGCRVGQGTAVLSGIHPEYNPSRLNPLDYQQGEPDLVTRLEHDDPARLLLWKSILAYLGLKISATNHAVPPTTPLLMCGSPCLGQSTRAHTTDHGVLFRLLEQEAAKHDHRVLQDLEYGFFINRFSPTLYALLTSTAAHQGPVGHVSAQSLGHSPRAYATHSSQTLDPTPQSLDKLLKELAVTPA
ncbi:biotin holocarboxylase synthetase, partial [Dimargaris verticillata]